MEEEIQQDVNTSESSTEEQVSSQPETSSEQESSENAIPHSRVKEMVEKAKSEGREEALRKLLAKQEEEQPRAQPKEEYRASESGTETDEALRILNKVIGEQLNPFREQFAKQEVEKFLDNNPDALNYVDKLKDLRKANPKLSWNEAYILASYNDRLKSIEKETLKKAEQNIAMKRAAGTEKPSPAQQQKKASTIADKLRDRSIPLAQLESEILKSQQ